AVVSMKFLPPGLMGVMVVAMLAATMSTMDTGLNRNAAIITQDVYPTLCRLFKRRPLEGKALLRLGQITTALLGILIISLALYFAANAGKQGIFGIMLNISATVHLPLVIPLALCLFVRRVPRWAAMATVAACLIPAILGFFSKEIFGQGWSFQKKFFITAPVGFCVFLLSSLFWKGEPESYRQRVAEFFRKMHTPVDFNREVGQASDFSQLRTVGIFAVIVGLFIGLLVFLPPDWTGRMQVLIVGGAICAVGVLMVLAPVIQARRRKAVEPSDNLQDNNEEQGSANPQEMAVPVTEKSSE
ncbi:MAG TPA: hypothetical protein PK082_10850, partial [Phycisphaerae bacterium]|nr:hypothetical protein [Phycisphaerae bacterium]